MKKNNRKVRKGTVDAKVSAQDQNDALVVPPTETTATDIVVGDTTPDAQDPAEDSVLPETEVQTSGDTPSSDSAGDTVPDTEETVTQEPPHEPRTCIVYITDGNSSDQCRMTWSLRSLCKHSRAKFDVIALSNDPIIPLDKVVPGLSDHGTYKNVLDMYATLVSAGITRKNWNRGWPFEVLYRLGIPLHPAFSEYERVLYLDTDTLVFSGRVDAFINASLDGFEIGGVADTVQEENNRIIAVLTHDIRPDFADRIISHYGQDMLSRAYINAGVILWNLVEIRKNIQWYVDRLGMFWEAETRGLVGFLDQDFINTMMRVKPDFSLVFNWFNGCNRETQNCVIRHYCGHQYESMAKRAVADALM